MADENKEAPPLGPQDTPAHPAEESFTPSAEDRIEALAGLTRLEYEQARQQMAKTLGVRVSELDHIVAAKRNIAKGEEGDAPLFPPIDPWPEAVNGAELLGVIMQLILTYCVLPAHSAPLMAAWVLHAWAHAAAEISPLLAVVSPEKRCGKTTALSVLGALVPKPLHAINISTPALFRIIEMYQPTLLVDEADTFLIGNDDMRGVLNGGHNRLSSRVVRCTGDDFQPQAFNVWSPKVIAMIGKLPDTLEDRSIVVPLRRKLPHEKVKRFRASRLEDFLPFARKAMRWANDNEFQLADADPVLPEQLNDRAQDNVRALCAIADLCGGEWPDLIRSSILGLYPHADEEPQSYGTMLLHDMADILATMPLGEMHSTLLCTNLCALEERPWGEWKGGKPMTTHSIAKLLKDYGIKPRRDSGGSYYALADVRDARDRYVSPSPANSATTATTATEDHGVEASKRPTSWQNGTCGTSGRGDGNNKHLSAEALPFEGEF